MLGVVRLGVLESRRTLAIYIAAGASFAALSARGLTIPLYAHGLGADRFQVGALFSVGTLAAALLSLPSGLLIDRFGARTLLIFSLVRPPPPPRSSRCSSGRSSADLVAAPSRRRCSQR